MSRILWVVDHIESTTRHRSPVTSTRVEISASRMSFALPQTNRFHQRPIRPLDWLNVSTIFSASFELLIELAFAAPCDGVKVGLRVLLLTDINAVMSGIYMCLKP